MHQEETASGISVDDMSEIDVLLEELVGKEESLRWLEIVSSTYILMGRYNHSLSLDSTIMVSKNCPTIGEHVVIIFVTIATALLAKTPLVTALGVYNSKTEPHLHNQFF